MSTTTSLNGVPGFIASINQQAGSGARPWRTYVLSNGGKYFSDDGRKATFDTPEGLVALDYMVKRFPTNLFATMFGFKEATYYQIPEGARAVPKVDFGGLKRP